MTSFPFPSPTRPFPPTLWYNSRPEVWLSRAQRSSLPRYLTHFLMFRNNVRFTLFRTVCLWRFFLIFWRRCSTPLTFKIDVISTFLTLTFALFWRVCFWLFSTFKTDAFNAHLQWTRFYDVGFWHFVHFYLTHLHFAVFNRHWNGIIKKYLRKANNYLFQDRANKALQLLIKFAVYASKPV